MHPLKAKRKPGPRPHEDLPAQTLEAAARILEMVDAGTLPAKPPPMTIPLDANGKPTRRLTRDDEVELATRIQTWGDIEARNALVLGNMGLVHMVARRIRRETADVDDLVQVGMLGLIRATETFDPTRGVKFSTYAIPWIHVHMQRHRDRLMRDDVPVMALEQSKSGHKQHPRLAVVHLDAQASNVDDGIEMHETIACSHERPDRLIERRQRENEIADELRHIARHDRDERMATIVERRLLDEETCTLEEIGQHFGVSREMVRQVESRLLKKARAAL